MTTLNGAAVPNRMRTKSGEGSKQIVAPLDVWKLPEGLEGHAVCAIDLIADASKPPNFAIDRVAEERDVILLKGAEKVTLKTWLALQLAIARITGGAWLGFDVVKARPRRVLFVSTETRGTVLVRRLLASCGQRVDAAVVAKFVHIIDKPITFVSQAERTRVRNKATGETQLKALGNYDKEKSASIRRSASDVADWAEANLGQNVDLLDAMAVPDTWSLIIVDTLRQCLSGDENSSNDARQFIAAARELARACGCPVLIVHHTGKGGDASDARSSRGSTELTAGPDVLISLDPSGAYPTANFLCRNFESPAPVGYKLVSNAAGDVTFDVLAACAGKGGIAEEEVLRVFEAQPRAGLTETTVRKLLATAQGKPKGSKASAKVVQKHIAALLARHAISNCKIVPKRGDDFDGYRLGADGGRVPAVQVDTTDAGDPFASATDV